MEVFKIELMIIDHDAVGKEGITALIEKARYPNRAIDPKVKKIESREVEWSDDHPLNKRDTHEAAYAELFKKE